jgi:uncharacterized delta-60 repeat protein
MLMNRNSSDFKRSAVCGKSAGLLSVLFCLITAFASGQTPNPPPNADEVQMAVSDYSVIEGAGARVTITVLYGGGSPDPVSVSYLTFDIGAVGNVDYVPVMGMLTFDPGETSKTFDIDIIDNTTIDNPRDFGVVLTDTVNAMLNDYSLETVSIVDDETLRFASMAGEFNFSAQLYRVTENESIPAALFNPAGTLPSVNNLNPNDRDPLGAVITVNRLNGSTGKVLVDYQTIDLIDPTVCNATNRGTNAVSPCDYLPRAGTLTFLDGQTSSSFLIPVRSDGNTNANGDKFLQISLSNPRPAPEENLNLIVPGLGPTNITTLQIVEVNSIWGVSIERATWGVSEGRGGINVDVILPFAATNGAVTVQVSTREANGTPSQYRYGLLAGSDYADPFDNLNFANPTYTDGTADIVNNADYTPTTVTLTFPQPAAGQPLTTVTRLRAFIPIIDDDVVEFNEDIGVYLHALTGGNPRPTIVNGFANVTIAFDDQPAGAADRTWNRHSVSSSDPPFNPVPGANGTVQAVAVQDDQKSVIGGDFTAFNSWPLNRLARINPNGSRDTTFNPGTGANDFVSDIAIYRANFATNTGKMIVVGGFSSFDNIQRNGIARLMPDGALDTSFSPGTGANGPIRAVLILGTGKIMIGGEFTSFNGISRKGVARLNSDGSLDMAFDSGSGANGTVWALGVDQSSSALQLSAGQSGGGAVEYRTNIDTRASSGILTVLFSPACYPDSLHVYYGGSLIFNSGPTNEYGGNFNPNDPFFPCDFNFFSGPIRYVIPYGPGPATDLTIVVNEGGMADTNTFWQFDATIENSVVGERVVVGGEFTTFDGLPRSGVARLTANGPVDPSFDPGGGTDGPVYAVGVQPNSKVLIGGAFTDFDFHARSRIARLNQDGSIDLSFDPLDGFDNSVYTIKLQSDGKPVVGGVFGSFDHVRRKGVARLFTNGALDTSFMDQAYNQFAGVVHPFSFEPSSFINSLALDSNGRVIIAGSFTNVGGGNSRAAIEPRFNVARLIGGYTPGPGNMEFSFDTYTVDEKSPSAAVTMRRIDGRLGTIRETVATGERLAQANVDYEDQSRLVTWPEWAITGAGVPRSVGSVGARFFTVPILDDNVIEGNELLNLIATTAIGTIDLGGEVIPVGGARARSSATLSITDDDVQHGTIAFSSSGFMTNENAGTARVTLIRTNGSVGPVSVTVFTRNGTALDRSDFLGKTNTISFDSGETTKEFTFTIIPDTTVEFDETVLIVLTNATGGASLPGGLATSTETATVTIIDDDFSRGRLNFSATNYVVNEGAPSAQVTVTRTGGSAQTLSVSVEATSGTATEGADFAGVTNVLSWAAGDTTPRTFTVPILEDSIVEGDETINLRLFNPSVAGALGSRDTATITVADNDFYGQLQFSQANYQTEENGTNLTITVIRTGGIGGTVSVDFQVADGTATIDADYTTNLITSTQLTFAPGETSKSFRIGLLNDDLAEGEETVLLSLSNPVNATLGAVSTSTLTIIDDEASNVPAGSVDTTFNPLVGPDQPVYAMALQPDGKLLIGGDFNTFNHITRHRLTRLLDDGSLDSGFNVAAGPNRSVRTMALQPDGKVIIGGLFTVVAGTNRNYIARLNHDGTVDTFLNPGAGADNPVNAVALLPDGRLAVGGAFTTFNGVPRQGIALVSTNGSLDLGFDPGLAANGVVYAVAVQPDGKILIGGDFTRVGTNDLRRVARLNLDGSVDSSFNPAGGANGPVRAILVQSDGSIVLGGTFTSFANSAHDYIVRLLGDGSVDSSFYSSAGANNSVYALAAQPDGKIMVAGDFTMFNGVTRNRLTRLNSNGKTDPTINFGSGANAFITSVLVQPDRKIVIGGGFSRCRDS